jgi:hypothetical protein
MLTEFLSAANAKLNPSFGINWNSSVPFTILSLSSSFSLCISTITFFHCVGYVFLELFQVCLIVHNVLFFQLYCTFFNFTISLSTFLFLIQLNYISFNFTKSHSTFLFLIQLYYIPFNFISFKLSASFSFSLFVSFSLSLFLSIYFSLSLSLFLSLSLCLSLFVSISIFVSFSLVVSFSLSLPLSPSLCLSLFSPHSLCIPVTHFHVHSV